MPPFNEEYQRFLHGEIDEEELKDRVEAWKVAQRSGTERIRKFRDLEYVNLAHMQWLPNFGLCYLNLEQIVSLVISDLGWKGEWLLDEVPDSDTATLTRQIKTGEKIYEKLPGRLMRQLLEDVRSNELPHKKPPKRFASYIQKEDSLPQPSLIYVHFDDVVDWLLKTQYADRKTLQKASTFIRYEEKEQKCKEAILAYARVIRLAYALKLEAVEGSYTIIAKHFPEEVEAIKHKFAHEALASYWDKAKDITRAPEKPLSEPSKQILLKILRRVSQLQPGELKGPHAATAVKRQMEKNGHSVDDGTIRKYLTEAERLAPDAESR